MSRASWPILLALLFAAVARAQTKPTTRTTDCTTSGCHAEQTKHTFLHGPNAVQACDACHDYADPAQHTFQLARQGADLCRFCHIDKAGTEGPVVHEPVAKGECTKCHDPHGANNRRMLKRDTTPQLCAECHKDALAAKHVHKPAGEDCTACHKAHTAQHPKLLIQEKKALCLSCHENVGKTDSAAAHPHDPMRKGDCLQCHSPHASDHPKALTNAPAALCLSCHKDVGEKSKGAGKKHAPMSDDRACLNCHVPHGSAHAKQLAADPIVSCLACHAKPIVVDKTKTVAALPELANDTLHKHGPIKQGECAACHTVHGGAHDRLLTQPYSREFYQPYSDAAYAFCFQCHKKETLFAASGESASKFRDGPRNLHALHVDRGAQGRSCRACHTPHASKHAPMITDAVAFGQWKLPINFKPATSGGSCAPGCHKPESYDRVTPVRPLVPSAPPPKPPPAPAATLPPAPAPPKK